MLDEKKEKKKAPVTEEQALLQSTEEMVCAPEFPEGCIDVEKDIDVLKDEKE